MKTHKKGKNQNATQHAKTESEKDQIKQKEEEIHQWKKREKLKRHTPNKKQAKSYNTT